MDNGQSAALRNEIRRNANTPCFSIEVQADTRSLLHILGLFADHNLIPSRMHMCVIESGGTSVLSIDAQFESLDPAVAAFLAEQIREYPMVLDLILGRRQIIPPAKSRPKDSDVLNWRRSEQKNQQRLR